MSRRTAKRHRSRTACQSAETGRRSVLVLNQYAVPAGSAGGTRHAELFERLRGWDHLIVAGDRNYLLDARHPATAPNFRLLPVSDFRANDWRRVVNWMSFAARVAVARFPDGRPDVVYASTPPLLTPLAGWLLARRLQARFVVEVRDLWPETLVALGRLRPGTFRHRLLAGLERWIYRRSDRIVGVTEGWRPHMDRLGVGPKFVVVPNGADPSTFVPTTAVSPELVARLGVYERVLVYAGAHGPANGLDAVLDAARRFPECAFVLVGGGMDKGRLQARAVSLGLPNVIFLDPLPKAELPALFARADVGIHSLRPSPLFELGMSPNKVHDYLAAGLPVVTNVGGELAEILAQSGAGFSRPTLSAAVEVAFTRDRDELAEMGANGRQWLERHRSRAALAARLEAMLDDIFPITRASGR